MCFGSHLNVRRPVQECIAVAVYSRVGHTVYEIILNAQQSIKITSKRKPSPEAVTTRQLPQLNQ